MPSPVDPILTRIDEVRKSNRGTEILYISLTALLFLCGIGCFIKAIVEGHYAWVIPPAFTTGFLYWPLKEIKDIRRKNIALATAPILITQLPPELAAVEIQRLLVMLYEEPKQ